MTQEQFLIPDEGEGKIELFRRQEVRKIMHNGEWWFSVKDVLEALTNSTDGNRYSRDIRERDPGLKANWDDITQSLPFQTGRGTQKTTFIDIEGMFRVIQSIPSEKVEPFKKWLAKVGFERLQEIENPELAVKRAITLYRAKGYDDEWIDARIRNKASREHLTAEWDKRGMRKNIGLLTDAISVGTFGISTSQHKAIKKLKSQSLRDNMTPIELTLTTLGEQATAQITKSTNPITTAQHMQVANQGGRIAGTALRNLEHATGQKVLSPTNYLTERQRKNNQNQLPDYGSILDKLLG
jgi:prophage antirepressor-like protein